MNVSLMWIKTISYTLLALLAFAGNSVLCRLALADSAVDATSFTAIRLFSGAIVLYILCCLKARSFVSVGSSSASSFGHWAAAALLFTYATLFSFAYLLLDAGVGALVLFGSVQMTMILVSIYRGHRLHIFEYLGAVIAFAGFVYLMWPSIVSANGNISWAGFALMVIAGIAWGGYTLMGKEVANPLTDTAFNFVKSLPFAMVLLPVLLFIPAIWSIDGVLLAVASGALTSGLGYAVWYAVLPNLSAVQAGVVQLLVPVIAALGGIVWIGESVTLSFIVATVVILGGICLVVFSRYRA